MKKKTWDVTVKDNPNKVVMGENDEFYTSDTEAYLIFNLQDKFFRPRTAILTLENRNDGSLKSEEVEVVDGVIEWEMPQRYIEHFGNWQVQLVYEQMKGAILEKYTSGVMPFTVNSHIKDKKKPSLVEIENWEKFIREGTELIETWEDLEALREENERQRQDNYQELLDTGVLQTNINNKLEQLEEEYAPKWTEVTAQLAQNEKKTEKIDAKLTTSRSTLTAFANVKKLKPSIMFVDDDGNNAVLSKLVPISQRTGVPFSVGLVSNFLLAGTGLGFDDARYLQEDLGWEILSHGKTHLGLTSPEATDELIEIDLKDSLIAMREKGLNVTNFVYPGGQFNEKVTRILSKYYNSGLSTDEFINVSPFNTYGLGRLAFPSGARTLAYYKSKVDEAVSKNGTLIWMIHCGQESFNAEQESILEQLIVYIKSIGVDVTTPQKMLDDYGSFIDVNNKQFYMGADGKNNMVNYIHTRSNLITGVEGLSLDMKPSDFEEYKTYTESIYTPAEIAKTPSKVRGNLTVVANKPLVHRFYVDADNNEYSCVSTTNDAWTEWRQTIKTTGMRVVEIPTFSVPANGFVNKTISIGSGYSSYRYGFAKPRVTLPNGIAYTHYLDGGSAVIRLTFQNMTGAAIDMGALNMDFFVSEVRPQ